MEPKTNKEEYGTEEPPVEPLARPWIARIRYRILNVGADRSINTYTDEPPSEVSHADYGLKPA